MPPQVSVVIKSYNHAKYVGEAIQSVLDQSFQNFEIVITDDGSSDGTADKIREFNDPRIRLRVFKKNRGISNAMNATIARARGEFVAILNSDDFALPGRLAREVSFLTANPTIGAVFGLPRTVDEQGQPTKSFFDFTIPFSLPDFSRVSLLRHFFFSSNCLCAPTAMVRRAVYAQVGSYDPRLTNLQDFDMWVRICTDHNIHILDEELTAFRIRGDQLNMSAPRRDTILRCSFEFAQILKHYRSMNPRLLKKVFARDLAEAKISTKQAPYRWLIELALTASLEAHQIFAVETLFDEAQSDDEFFRLRDLTGSLDLFGTESKAEVGVLRRTVAACDERMSELSRDAETHLETTAFLRTELNELNQQVVVADAELRRLASEVQDRDQRLGAADQELRHVFEMTDNNLRELIGKVQDRDQQLVAADQELRRVLEATDNDLRELIRQVQDRDQQLMAADAELRRLAAEVQDRDRRLLAVDQEFRRVIEVADSNLRQVIRQTQERDQQLVIADAELRRLTAEVQVRDQRLAAADQELRHVTEVADNNLRQLSRQVEERDQQIIVADAGLRRLATEAQERDQRIQALLDQRDRLEATAAFRLMRFIRRRFGRS
jgi:glycosyltransferase involved in cell wall biosynthesis